MQAIEKPAELSAEERQAVGSWLTATADMIEKVAKASEWHVAAMRAAIWQKAIIEQEVEHAS
jgi:hypothetical protein